MDITNQNQTIKQKFKRINMTASEKRDNLFIREMNQLKKELSRYASESTKILVSCRESLDLEKTSQIKSAIQSQK